MPTQLSLNVDHVATLRQARRALLPDPVEAARIALDAGAAGITIHLREDRRHIQDDDLRRLRALRRGVLNLEMALTEEMIGIALEVRPDRVTLVPEKRLELTTEGGLDLTRRASAVARGIEQIAGAGIPVSLFLDPEPAIVEAAPATGAAIVELHTGAYSNASGSDREAELDRLALAARGLLAAGLTPHAGHGLTTGNVGPLLRRYPFPEMSIGHSIIARAVIVGLEAAVREMLAALRET
ncbi:MAG TPA: pyridoxine 5'-phosphate synthase [Candidatus Eisenbacteria bacterium]|jgi:pyridoxine 5-phosphate synthase